MTKYQLAKLVLMCGAMQSRKRVQKTVHLLQAAGCDFGLDFRLHYYGPYSAELAALLDEMATEGILLESECPWPYGTRYDYRFSEKFRDALDRYEGTPSGREAKAEMEAHAPLVGEFNQEEPKVLELASTIVHLRNQGCSSDDAVTKTCRVKNEPADSPRIAKAHSLSRIVLSFGHG
jgi:uncharacterized protein YwgA